MEKDAFSIGYDKPNKELEKLFELINYFGSSDIDEEARISISIIKEGHEKFIFPDVEIYDEYDENAFDQLYKHKLESSKYPEHVFLKMELKHILDNFDLLRDNYPVIKLWEVYLENKLNKTEFPEKYSNEPENPYPRIFVDGYCYNFFLSLKGLIVEEESAYADYSFIYNMMKKDGYLHHITEPIFIQFLNNYCNMDIVHKQFKYSITKRKKKIYNNEKQRFKLPDKTV